MKGFEIIYNGYITHVAVNDGLLVIHISSLHGNGNLHVYGVNYEEKTRVVWYDNVCLSCGDSVDIKFIDIINPSAPIKCIYDENIKQPISKLEMFLVLERYLTNKGLL